MSHGQTVLVLTVILVATALIVLSINVNTDKIADSIEAGRGMDTVKVEVRGPFRDVIHYVLLAGCDTIAIARAEVFDSYHARHEYDRTGKRRLQKFPFRTGYVLDSLSCEGKGFIDIWEVW